MALPEVPLITPGSGGGLFGAIKRKFEERAELMEVFGNTDGTARVHPGQVPPGTPLPFVSLSVVAARSEYAASSDVNGNVVYLNIWYTTFQVSTFAVGYDSARMWSKRAHRFIDRKVFAVDCAQAIPYVGNLTVMLDPKRSEDGKEVWQFAYRYDVKLPEYQSWEDDPENGVHNQGGPI